MVMMMMMMMQYNVMQALRKGFARPVQSSKTCCHAAPSCSYADPCWAVTELAVGTILDLWGLDLRSLDLLLDVSRTVNLVSRQ
eukprot:9813847-Karenia_brevis.AAC.1